MTSPTTAIKNGLHYCLRADAKGRSPRSEFWWFTLFTWFSFIFVSFIICLAVGESKPDDGVIAIAFVFLILALCTCLYCNQIIDARRFHDSNTSACVLVFIKGCVIALIIAKQGLKSLVYTVSFDALLAFNSVFTLLLLVAFIVLMVLYCTSGTKGPNRFGPDPLDPTAQPVPQPVAPTQQAEPSQNVAPAQPTEPSQEPTQPILTDLTDSPNLSTQDSQSWDEILIAGSLIIKQADELEKVYTPLRTYQNQLIKAAESDRTVGDVERTHHNIEQNLIKMIDNCEQYMELSITASSLKARIAPMIAAANMSNQTIPRPVSELNQYLDDLLDICSHMPQQIENYHKLIEDGRKMIDELHKRLDASIDDFLKSFISDGTDLNQMLKR